MSDNLEELADSLFRSYEKNIPCAPIRGEIGSDNIDDAYKIQNINTKRWIDSGRKRVGCKIGLTSRTVQKQLGVDQPDYGVLFSDMCFADGEDTARFSFIQPKIEGEIAFVFKRDIPNEHCTIADIINAIDYGLAAIEIVDSRVENWDITIADTIADNASCGAFVLGTLPVSLNDIDLRLCGMSLEDNGEIVSSGAGAACMGNPLVSTQWLARTMARAGNPIQAGDIVLSGALGPMVDAIPGHTYELQINGLGSVKTFFEGARSVQ